MMIQHQELMQISEIHSENDAGVREKKHTSSNLEKTQKSYSSLKKSHPNIHGKEASAQKPNLIWDLFFCYCSSNKKAKRSLVAGVRFQLHRTGGWENVGNTMRWVTLTSTNCSVSLRVTTMQGREDICNVAPQSSLKRRTSKGFKGAVRRSRGQRGQ